MHQDHIQRWQHRHVFNADKKHLEQKTLIVVVITFVMMIAEIFFGFLTNSMALLADGWHMGTHAFALGLSLFAYVVARKHAENNRFTFGTWKVEILGAYTSALFLGLVGLSMIWTSLERLLHPLAIRYAEALLVALLGLVVNLVCALVLANDPAGHQHHHDHDHAAHRPAEKDLNLKSAYIHVVTDAFTSILAIAALVGAKYFSFAWLDPVMGFVGAGLILSWAFPLLRDAAAVLLDHDRGSPLAQEVSAQIENDGDSQIADLHLWKVGDDKYACIVSVVNNGTRSVEEYKRRLSSIEELAHVTVELHTCSCQSANGEK